MNFLNDLIAKAQQLTSGETVEFMNGREKADLPVGEVVTVVDFDFLKGDNGDYVVFIIREDDAHFFFGGSVLTEKFQILKDNLLETELEELLGAGIEIVTTKKKAKATKRVYTDVILFPNNR